MKLTRQSYLAQHKHKRGINIKHHEIHRPTAVNNFILKVTDIFK